MSVCVFLAQEKVGSFSELSDCEKLRQTERAADSVLLEKHGTEQQQRNNDQQNSYKDAQWSSQQNTMTKMQRHAKFKLKHERVESIEASVQ